MKKLYVMVRTDLSVSQQAVQAGHAVAEIILRGQQGDWDNGTLVYLGANSEEDLEKQIFRLERKDIPFSIFREPDIGNQITAIAAVDDGRAFANKKLL